MPPQISDDEASDISSETEHVAKATTKTEKPSKATTATKQEALMVESDHDDEEDEDNEIGEDEYVVEEILSHVIDEDGVLKFEVKWEGFEKKSDRTWEPEENLETAPRMLDDYLASVGGKEAIISAWEEKKSGAVKKSKKRGRVSTTTEGVNGSKRGKKAHPATEGLPASAKEFKPPSGNWEEEVVGIDACEGSEGSIVVYLTWKGGEKTQHPLQQVYKRCPQKMLKFYENHLVFKKNDEESV